MTYPLYVAFVWHMHQPYYQNSFTGEHKLPWVRLHATKDYLHMAEILLDFPKIRQTFNIVPSLAEQLVDYLDNDAVDRCLQLTEKPAESLSDEDKEFILGFFFSIDWDRIIRKYPRYWQLLQLRQAAGGDWRLFSVEFWRDLQVWFNLVWIDPNWIERDPDLQYLVKKQSRFTLEDVQLLVAKQREIMAKTLPLYRQLEAAGQIEITTSPYYHPILPLLIDTASCRVASPGLPLPEMRFSHAEDGAEQLRLALEAHQKYFGKRPRGLWPSEGAVSHRLVSLLAERNTVQWLASDEAILSLSVNTVAQRDGYGHLTNPWFLYRPYCLRTDESKGQAPIAMVFRDRVLSDRIGFVYRQFAGPDGAFDLMQRLHKIRENLNDPDHPYLVSIILDGENCWEGYEHNGDVFLRKLYELLSNDDQICTTTVSDYLDQFPPTENIDNLFTGSWINHSLETWIGEPEQNKAWDYLSRSRDRLIAWQNENPLADDGTLEKAWREIYIAEGSDWFWWYYSQNDSGQDHLFDQEFRGHLSNVYRIMGLPVPLWLQQPILGTAQKLTSRVISGYISPRLAGADVASSEWAAGGYVEPETSTGAMQRTRTIIKRLYYGFNPAELFLRLESWESLDLYSVAIYFGLADAQVVNYCSRFAPGEVQCGPPDVTFSFELLLDWGSAKASLSKATGEEGWQMVEQI
ncbi:MAG: glycoside hydrolase family 57 protein, partial [Dehalococcoidia bacterium]|nr:glycoside hydrolase family 57 protein [Dehalococcoidia bacterium]